MKRQKYAQDWQLIEQLRAGQRDRLNWFYQQHRQDFLQWTIRSYGAHAEDAADVYQDAVIVMYENIMSGKLSELNSSLKTYLFAIGRNLLFKKFGKQPAPHADLSHVEDATLDESEADTADLLNARQEVVVAELAGLDEPCRQLLTYFYFERYSMSVIAEKMGYKNHNVAKSQKLRCFKKLRERVTLAMQQREI